MQPKTKLKISSSATAGGGKPIQTPVEVIKTQPLDHWSFLDEIEAPMWADLNSCNTTTEDIDDEWFHISHPFHQCSSRQLISAFFHSGEVGQSKISIQEPPSPKLPPSVSRSRGKSYRSKEWGQSKCGAATSSQQHPVKNLVKKFSGSSGSSNEAKTISGSGKLSEGPNGCSSCESGITDTSGPKFSRCHLNSLARQEGERNSMSTVTSDHNDHLQKKFSEVSTLSQTSGLLSSLRISLRRSCTTRPAARFGVNGARRSVGCKSSSKSTVGSSLLSGSVGKISTLGEGDIRIKDKTPDSRNVMRISQPTVNKLKVPNVSKVPVVDIHYISNTTPGNDSFAPKLTAKGKAQQHTSRAKALMPLKVNELHQVIAKNAEKGAGRQNVVLANDKENASRTNGASHKCKSSDKAAQCMGHAKKASDQNLLRKNDRKILTGLKEMTNNQVRDKNSVNAARKAYFR